MKKPESIKINEITEIKFGLQDLKKVYKMLVIVEINGEPVSSTDVWIPKVEEDKKTA